MPKIDAALALAAKGYAVFPCEPNGKRPITPNGFKAATRDPDQITKWWNDEPNANPAIYPDACEPRLLVVDIDTKGGARGYETLAELRSLHLCPPTLAVETPSGGRHLYYGLRDDDAPIQSSAGRLGSGVDVRSHGGYVLAVGAEIDGHPYFQIDGTGPLTECPEGLRNLAGAAPEQSQRARELAEGVEDWDLPSNIERAQAFLRVTDPAIEGQGGNDWTYRTAAVVRDFGISENLCVDLMRDSEWNERCIPPWEHYELQVVVQHVYEYANRPAGEARSAAPGTLETMQARAKAAQAAAGPEVPKKSPFAVKWHDEVEAMEEPKWLIENTIPERSLVFLYGPQRTYKSFLVLDMLAALAQGVAWQGHQTTRPSTVIYVAGEGSLGFKKRRKAQSTLRNDRIDKLGFVDTMPRFVALDQWEDFAQEMMKEKPALVVIDTLSKAMVGRDISNPADAAEFDQQMIELIKHVGCSVIIVAHSGKDEKRGIKGASDYAQDADVVFSVRSTRDRYSILTMEKQKDAEEWDGPMAFHLRNLAESLVPEQCALGHADIALADPEIDANRAAIDTALMDAKAPLSTKALAHAVCVLLRPGMVEDTEIDQDKIVEAKRVWINEKKRKGEFKEYIYNDGTTKTTLWKHPDKQQENDDE